MKATLPHTRDLAPMPPTTACNHHKTLAMQKLKEQWEAIAFSSSCSDFTHHFSIRFLSWDAPVICEFSVRTHDFVLLPPMLAHNHHEALAFQKERQETIAYSLIISFTFFDSIAIHGANLQTRKSQVIGKIRPCHCHLLTFT
jgi:hypothetical protein